jgi:hypothetical protein
MSDPFSRPDSLPVSPQQASYPIWSAGDSADEWSVSFSASKAPTPTAFDPFSAPPAPPQVFHPCMVDLQHMTLPFSIPFSIPSPHLSQIDDAWTIDPLNAPRFRLLSLVGS